MKPHSTHAFFACHSRRESASSTARLLLILLALLLPLPARAHVGNKDVFEQVKAGPYTLFVTIRTPTVIPGVATVEVLPSGAAVTHLTMTPMLLTGEAAKHPPTADTMTISPANPGLYTGTVWLMASGSWQVRFEVDGASGHATASVPVPAAALSILHMDRGMGLLLGALGVVLVIGAVGIVMAATREARLAPAVPATPERKRRALLAGVGTLVLLVLAIAAGGHWWNVEAADYASDLYRANELRPALQGSLLTLTIGTPDKEAEGGLRPVKNAQLLLDHGKPMHLYAIRMPEMDAVYHLHPEATGKSGLRESLPAMPPGDYKLFADVVFANGFPETEVATITIPAGFSNAPLAADDASAAPPALSLGELGPRFHLPDGYTMVWTVPENAIAANRAYAFTFTLLDRQGQPATDVEPYLGMAGHAAFVKTDLTAFAHTHPDGSAAMPALMIANENTSAGAGMSDMSLGSSTTAAAMDSMPGMTDAEMKAMPGMANKPLPATVSFPYGFPSPGRYRIFIQMKHSGTVETGVFDAEVK